MQLVYDILQGSLLWRFLAAVCGWFGRQWQSSRVVQGFLRPTALGENIARSSIFFRLWSRLRELFTLLYQKLKLDRVFTGSVFLQNFFWCTLAAVLAPMLSTMQAAALVVAAFCSLALRLVREGSKPLAYAPANKYILLFAGVYLAAAVLSVNPQESLLPGLLTFCFVLFSLVVENGADSRRKLHTFTALLVLAATAVSLLGVAQYVFGVSGEASWVDSDMFSVSTRVYATLENPNVLGEYLVLIFPLGGSLLLTAKSWGQRVLWLLCCGLMGLCLLMTLSRGSWVSLLLAGGIFFLLLKPQLIVLAPVVLVGLAAVMPASVMERFSSIGNLQDSSTSYRVAIWMGSVAMLKDYWLSGVGPGTGAFNLVYPRYSYNAANAEHAHSLYLQMAADGGICALLVFLVVILALCRQLCAAMAKNKKWETRLFLIGILSGMGGFLANGMTDHAFYNYRVMLLFWVVAGLGMAWARFAAEEAEA